VSAQTLLAELALSDLSAAAASSGTLTLNSISDDTSANATGTASWFRIVDSDGNAVVDGDVGTSGVGPQLRLGVVRVRRDCVGDLVRDNRG
jgi:hypothetical protein